jgi:Zn finger protein HypA/HybF involved in hydrogenase expression
VHEVSLVAELVDAVVERSGGAPVSLVRVRHATTIPSDVLEQAWAMLTDEGPLAGSVLEAEPFEIRIACPTCGYAGPVGHDDVVAPSIASCPSCGGIVTFPPTAEIELLEVRTTTA